jgi:hypothetical protein
MKKMHRNHTQAPQSLMAMIWTGQRSDASRAQASRSSVGVPSAILPSIRYFSTILLNESSGSSSNNPGHASQHEPQLTQVDRSIFTFIVISLLMVHGKPDPIKIRIGESPEITRDPRRISRMQIGLLSAMSHTLTTENRACPARDSSGASMDYTDMLRDAWNYSRQGVFENRGRWIRLILAIILLAIPMNGYVMRIYQGAGAAPEIDRWGRLCIDGLKLIIVGLIYSIPILIVWLVTYGAMMAAIFSGHADPATMAGWEPNVGLMILMYIVEIAVALVLPVASVRFARSGKFSEAFRFGAIVDRIGKIGWINYVIAIFLVAILVAVPVMVLVFFFVVLGIFLAALTNFSLAAVLGLVAVAVVLFLCLFPLLMVFQARYWTRLYDSAPPAESPKE